MADIRAITFNCASGNPKITTDPVAFLGLPFYQQVLDGDPDAAIIGLQEVAPAQARALRNRAASGNFRLITLSRPGQGNALLIPNRYTVLEHHTGYYVWPQVRALARAAGRDRSDLNTRQYLELRMWLQARVHDLGSGRDLTVFCTHLSGDPELRLAQATSLFERVHRTLSPVLLLADLNVKPGSAHPADIATRGLFDPLQDMCPAATSKRPAIDWILATGLAPLSCKVHTELGDTLSDHYAKEALMRFADPT